MVLWYDWDFHNHDIVTNINTKYSKQVCVLDMDLHKATNLLAICGLSSVSLMPTLYLDKKKLTGAIGLSPNENNFPIAYIFNNIIFENLTKFVSLVPIPNHKLFNLK